MIYIVYIAVIADMDYVVMWIGWVCYGELTKLRVYSLFMVSGIIDLEKKVSDGS